MKKVYEKPVGEFISFALDEDLTAPNWPALQESSASEDLGGVGGNTSVNIGTESGW